MRKVETFMTVDPVCPYCGGTFKEAMALHYNKDEMTSVDCGDCGKAMIVARFITALYSTAKKKWPERQR